MSEDDKIIQEAPQAYTLEHLLQHSQELFAVNPETIHGAVYGLNKTEYTVAEVAGLVKSFLGKVVK